MCKCCNGYIIITVCTYYITIKNVKKLITPLFKFSTKSRKKIWFKVLIKSTIMQKCKFDPS